MSLKEMLLVAITVSIFLLFSEVHNILTEVRKLTAHIETAK